MNVESLKQKLEKLRIQARNQVIILVSSLIFIFLWFSAFSSLTQRQSFSSEAFMSGGEALGIEPAALSISIGPIILFIAISFTCIYVYIAKKLAPSLKKNLDT